MVNATSLAVADIIELQALLATRDAELASERAARLVAEAALAEARADLTIRSLLIEKLKLHIAKLRRMAFGKSSEKLAGQIAQLELALEELETAEAAVVPSKAEKTTVDRQSAQRALPDHLPREVIIHLPESGACICPDCGGELRRLGADEDEMLDIEPVVYKVIRHVRPKFSCRKCEKITQAPAPDKPIARGKATFRLISHVLVSKFDHHLPLYRQAEMMAAQGIPTDRSTLAARVGQACALLEPIVTRIREIGLTAAKLHTDDTPVKMLDPGHGKTRTARLWTYAADERNHNGAMPPMVWYKFTTDRRQDHPFLELKDFRGYLQADGYTGYNALYKAGTAIEVACWGHARRQFWDLHEQGATALTTEFLERIGAFYRVEEEIRGLPPDQRREVRQCKTKPLVADLLVRLKQTLPRLSRSGGMAEAINYSVNRWEALTRFLDDGRLEIDNLIAERALRGIAIGRRNWLFAGSKVGGERAAEIYTIIETCKRNGVDPFTYITDVMTKIASGWPNRRLDELLPWNWRLLPSAHAS